MPTVTRSRKSTQFVCFCLSRSDKFTNGVTNEEIFQRLTANGNAKLPSYARPKRRTQQNNPSDL